MCNAGLFNVHCNIYVPEQTVYRYYMAVTFASFIAFCQQYSSWPGHAGVKGNEQDITMAIIVSQNT